MDGRLGRLTAFAVSAAIFTTGCGGGEGDDGGAGSEREQTPPGVSMSRPEFLKAAGKACREVRANLEGDVLIFLRRQRQTTSKPEPVIYKDLSRLVLLPTIEAEMEAIRTLGVPPSEEERIEEILDEGEFTINEVVYEPRVPSIESVYRAFADTHRMFRGYGLPACVNGSDVTGGDA